jgi:DNA-binding protein HU-beta
MNQPELFAILAEATGFTKTTVETVIKAQGTIVQAALRAGDEVPLPGLGKFTVTAVASRPGRNPSTGEAMTIAARNKPGFSTAKALKDAVN